ncbi:hypothetical protein AMATHDRAFT_9457, partial [Amanita thiersii Skay4041]
MSFIHTDFFNTDAFYLNQGSNVWIDSGISVDDVEMMDVDPDVKMANSEVAIAVDKFISALADRYGTPMDVDRPEDLSYMNVPVTDT